MQYRTMATRKLIITILIIFFQNRADALCIPCPKEGISLASFLECDCSLPKFHDEAKKKCVYYFQCPVSYFNDADAPKKPEDDSLKALKVLLKNLEFLGQLKTTKLLKHKVPEPPVSEESSKPPKESSKTPKELPSLLKIPKELPPLLKIPKNPELEPPQASKDIILLIRVLDKKAKELKKKLPILLGPILGMILIQNGEIYARCKNNPLCIIGELIQRKKDDKLTSHLKVAMNEVIQIYHKGFDELEEMFKKECKKEECVLVQELLKMGKLFPENLEDLSDIQRITAKLKKYISDSDDESEKDKKDN